MSWKVLWRTALVVSVLVAALGATLFRFVGAEPRWLIGGAAVLAGWVGMHLPALAPRHDHQVSR